MGDVNGDTWWLTCNVTNPGKQDVTNLTATISGATLMPLDTTTLNSGGRLLPGGSATMKIDVFLPNELDVQVGAQSFAPRGALSLDLASPNGKTWSANGSATSKLLTLKLPELIEGGFGIWTATVTHTGGLRSISYSLTASETHPPPDANQTWPTLAPGETHAFEWYVTTANAGTPPNATIMVAADVPAAGNTTDRVTYIAGGGAHSAIPPRAAATVPLTSGEFLGFSALGILSLSVASGALRIRGGRATSQDRARKEVSAHRLAWLAALVLIPIHGLVQIGSGHLNDTGAISLGVGAFAALVSLVWFNAFQRSRVLAIAWPKWVTLKLAWAAVIGALIAAHILLYGRHFVG